MNTNIRTRKVDVGRITGLNSYELAVKTGKFSGTLQEYLDKEMATHQQMKDYADQAMVDMDNKIASMTDNSSNMAEVIDARDTYDTLGQRLDATEGDIAIMMERVNALMNNTLASGDIISDARIDENGYLIITVKDVTADHIQAIGGGRIIEMRNTGSHLQWRYKGLSMWTNLMALRDVVPKIKIGEVITTDDGGEAAASITGTPENPVLNLAIPKGPMGSNGGEILDAHVNDEGELNITVSASEFTLPEGGAYPVLTIGEVHTVAHTEPAKATITGTYTNPVLNLWIPKGEPPKISKAWIADDGFLQIEYE